MSDAFKPGDVVQLKSGGPLMTIVEYGEYTDGRKVLCEWFDDKKKLDRSKFLEIQLVANNRGGLT